MYKRQALEHREPSLKIRGVRLQNPILDVVTFCAAHGEEAVALQLEDLTARQVQNMGTNTVYLAAVPIVHGVSFQRIIVFMVAADEGQREGQAFQPVQRFIVAAVAKPHAAAVSGDDDRVILRHVTLPAIGRFSAEGIPCHRGIRFCVGSASEARHPARPFSDVFQRCRGDGVIHILPF